MKSTGKKVTRGAGTHKWAMTERAPRGEGGYQFQKHRGSRYTQDRHTNNLRITGLIAQTPSQNRSTPPRTDSHRRHRRTRQWHAARKSPGIFTRAEFVG